MLYCTAINQINLNHIRSLKRLTSASFPPKCLFQCHGKEITWSKSSCVSFVSQSYGVTVRAAACSDHIGVKLWDSYLLFGIRFVFILFKHVICRVSVHLVSGDPQVSFSLVCSDKYQFICPVKVCSIQIETIMAKHVGHMGTTFQKLLLLHLSSNTPEDVR